MLGLLGLSGACRKAPEPAADAQAAADIIKDIGLAQPSAVLHDADFDRYYIANMNGAAGVADDNGFITSVSTLGEPTILKWINGDSLAVNLGAPRGMAMAGPFLYVTDITTIRRFDRRNGSPDGEVPIPGAVALDGMSSDASGNLYFTDSGDSTHAGAVYRLGQDGRIDTLARGPELGHPTGIAVSGDSVWVVSREGEMYRVTGGAKAEVVKLPVAGLTGVVMFQGDAFVSSSEGRSVLRGKIGGPFAPLLSDVDDPGIPGHDLWRHRVLVPLPGKNEVRIVRLAF